MAFGPSASATGCRVPRWVLDRDHPVRFLDGRRGDGTGRILSHGVPFFLIPSHFPHSKADISPDSKLKGRSPDALEPNLFETCTILSRFVPPGPRGVVQEVPRSSAESVEPRGHSAVGVIQQWYGGITRLGKRQVSSVIQMRLPCGDGLDDCKVSFGLLVASLLRHRQLETASFDKFRMSKYPRATALCDGLLNRPCCLQRFSILVYNTGLM